MTAIKQNIFYDNRNTLKINNEKVIRKISKYFQVTYF